MPPKKNKKDNTPSGGEKEDRGKVSGKNQGKKGAVSKKASPGGKKKTPPELLIALASAAAALTVESEDGHPPSAAFGATANVVVASADDAGAGGSGTSTMVTTANTNNDSPTMRGAKGGRKVGMRLAKVGANKDATGIVPGVVPDVAGVVEAAASTSISPAAAAQPNLVGRQEALRDVLQFQKIFWKANEKDVDLPNWADSSEDEESEEENEELQEEAEVEVVNDGEYPFDKGLFDDEKDELEDDDLLS
jgi:hypothetical protein